MEALAMEALPSNVEGACYIKRFHQIKELALYYGGAIFKGTHVKWRER